MPALRTEQILRSEAEEILAHRNGDGQPTPKLEEAHKGRVLYRKLNECNFSALCLSGGGIRSAAFSLGVIQALAAHPRSVSAAEWDTISDQEIANRAKNSLLAKFDYLSTVSGGGYIGSWLSAWCSREGFQRVWKQLVARPDSPDVEPGQIGWLRSYSNYLTPKVGMMSSDTWSAFSVYICNLFLNWLIILPVFCGAVLGLKLLAVGLDALVVTKNWFSPDDLKNWPWYPWFDNEQFCWCLKGLDKQLPINWQPYLVCGIVGLLALTFALSFITRYRILRHRSTAAEASARQKSFVKWALLPSIASAVLVAQVLGSDPIGKLFERLDHDCEPLRGALVATVDKNGPAKFGGVAFGDVIVQFDGHDVKSIDDIYQLVADVQNGRDIPVVIIHKGEETSKTVRPDDSGATRVPDKAKKAVTQADNAHLRLGMTLEDRYSLIPKYPLSGLIGIGSIIGAIIYVIGYSVGWIIDRPKLDLMDLVAWLSSGCIYGALVSLAFYLCLAYPGAKQQTDTMFTDSPALPLTIGVPWILSAQVIAQYVFIGLSSYQSQSEADREWLARAGGWMLVAAIAWFAMSFLTFGALLLLLQSEAVRNFFVSLVPISGLSGIVTALLGKSSLTQGALKSESKSTWVKLANIALAIAAPLFIAGLIFVLSIAIDEIFLGKLLFEDFSMTSGDADNYGFKQNVETVLTEFLVPLSVSLSMFAVLGFGASYFININRFSLHAFYRNRLIRAFLGASRKRKPDLFTGFDSKDNPKLHTLWPRKKDSVWQPFGIINMTLNLVSGKRLSWQERKAAPFTASPLHCGTASTFEKSRRRENPEEEPRGAYRASTAYGAGISLGTAMAISGAAASPNMGYHSSSAVTFLMTMLNVRLGWWLGNPAFERGAPYKNDGPTWAILPLLEEAFGMTTDDRKYVYLSDGGHFENLGLYEMVRRRCRFIVVVDATYDPSFSFEDLGNTIRKIAIDLGVPIRFQGIEKLKQRTDKAVVGADQDYHALGDIDYHAADGAQDNGAILYIKPAYHGIKDPGVRAYASANVDFPHQSTLHQWFTESQFESYRALGFEIMDGIVRQAMEDAKCAKNPSLENVFQALRRRMENTLAIEWAAGF